MPEVGDYGNTKITQHALKTVSLQNVEVGHYMDEAEPNNHLHLHLMSMFMVDVQQNNRDSLPWVWQGF